MFVRSILAVKNVLSVLTSVNDMKSDIVNGRIRQILRKG